MPKSAQEIIDSAAAQGEPVFVLRAKDIYAPDIVRQYLVRASSSSSVDMVEDLQEVIWSMTKWQNDNPDKVRFPD